MRALVWKPACVTLLELAGSVEYLDEPLHGEPEGGALLCCAIPGRNLAGGLLVLDL